MRVRGGRDPLVGGTLHAATKPQNVEAARPGPNMRPRPGARLRPDRTAKGPSFQAGPGERIRGPRFSRRDQFPPIGMIIERAYLAGDQGARNPKSDDRPTHIFLPGKRPTGGALRAASARGVRVILLLQGRVEYFLVHYANARASIISCWRLASRFTEYQRSFPACQGLRWFDSRWATGRIFQ